jgi:Yip1 domain
MSEQPESSLYGQEAPPTAPKPPGLLDQILGVFTEPVTLFQKLNLAPSWLWAILVSLLVGLAITIAWGLKVDVDAMLRPALEANPKIGADQIDMIIGMQKKFILPFSVLGAVVFPFLAALLVGFVYWLVGRGMAEGEPPTYVHALSAAAVPGLVMLPHGLAILVMCLVREVGGATPDKLAPTSLGFFLHPDSPKLQAMMILLDPFILASWGLTWLATRHIMRLKAPGATICTVIVVLFTIGMRLLGAR